MIAVFVRKVTGIFLYSGLILIAATSLMGRDCLNDLEYFTVTKLSRFLMPICEAMNQFGMAL